MTDDMMTLRGLLEKSSDADLLREMIGFAARRRRGRRSGSTTATATGTGSGRPAPARSS